MTSEPDPDSAPQSTPLSRRWDRRAVIRTAAVAGAVVATGSGLAACGPDQPTYAAPASGGGATSAVPSGTTKQGTTLGNAADIAVGGGTVFADQNVVVTQPDPGTFKGFSSTCTHLGCQVDKVADGLIQCPCHGSRYRIADGSVQAGPAPRPLPSANVTVRDGKIVLPATDRMSHPRPTSSGITAGPGWPQ